MNTCEATPSAAQEIRIQSLGTPEIDSPLSRNLATAGERRVVFTVDEELVDEGAAPRPMSFELAGPRDRIYFDPSKTKCAIVTCGGLCPGINDVIRAIVMTAYNAYRVPSVLGIRYGLQGFIPSYRYDVRELAPRDVEGIHEFGGTILGTSRGPQSSSEIATALERLNISALFIIGGDGTMKAAASIQQEVARRGKHISIVGIPKTIDNDINFIPHSFGFETAVDKAGRRHPLRPYRGRQRLQRHRHRQADGARIGLHRRQRLPLHARSQFRARPRGPFQPLRRAGPVPGSGKMPCRALPRRARRGGGGGAGSAFPSTKPAATPRATRRSATSPGSCARRSPNTFQPKRYLTISNTSIRAT